MAQAWRSARRFSIAALVAAFTLMIAAALLGTPDVAAASANSSGRYAKPHVDVVVWGSLSPRPAPGPPGSPTQAGAAEEIVAAGAPEVPVPAPQVPAPDGPVRSPVPPVVAAAAPTETAKAAAPHHPAQVRSLDTERLGRSLVFTGGAAALLAGYGLILVGARRRLW